MAKWITRTATTTKYRVFAGENFVGVYDDKPDMSEIAKAYNVDVRDVAIVTYQDNPVLVGMKEEDFLAAAEIMENARTSTGEKYIAN